MPAAFVMLIRLAALCAALLVAGCAVLPRNAIPVEKMGVATVPGMPDVRGWAGRSSEPIARDLAQSFAQESPADFAPAAGGPIRYAHLALSGGGANGAFGAGYLNGWTKAGNRPVFKIVTGVSTGALMAPFAFLGPAHDDALREFYTTTDTRSIFRMLSIVRQLLFGEALADLAPLETLIARHVDAALLRDVADAHHRGRRLYIGTTDLDSQHFVVWNMGLIAASAHPQALDLFRKVMLASATIPVAFPPVFFDVEAEGRIYDEMHVDGSVATRVFLNGGLFSVAAARAKLGLPPVPEDIYIVHNGQLLPVPEPTRRSLTSVALRVFESAGKGAVTGDLFRLYAIAVREHAGFHWVTIPEDVGLAGDELFDPVKMRELYELGYRIALAGPVWHTAPPGLDAVPRN
jgi:hypothetical protein